MAVKSISERARDFAGDVEALEAALKAERKNVDVLQKKVARLSAFERAAKFIEVRDSKNPDRLLGLIHRGALPDMRPGSTHLSIRTFPPLSITVTDAPLGIPSMFDAYAIRLDLGFYDAVPGQGPQTVFFTDARLDHLRYVRGFEPLDMDHEAMLRRGIR